MRASGIASHFLFRMAGSLFILYDRPLVDTVCSGSHYNWTAISIHIFSFILFYQIFLGRELVSQLMITFLLQLAPL